MNGVAAEIVEVLLKGLLVELLLKGGKAELPIVECVADVAVCNWTVPVPVVWGVPVLAPVAGDVTGAGGLNNRVSDGSGVPVVMVVGMARPPFPIGVDGGGVGLDTMSMRHHSSNKFRVTDSRQ